MFKPLISAILLMSIISLAKEFLERGIDTSRWIDDIVEASLCGQVWYEERWIEIPENVGFLNTSN